MTAITHTGTRHVFSGSGDTDTHTHTQRHTRVSVTCTELLQGWKVLHAISVLRAPLPDALGSCLLGTSQVALHEPVTESLRCHEALPPAGVW